MKKIPTFKMAAIRSFPCEENSPFEMLVQCLKKDAHYGCFIFAENVSVNAIDSWKNDSNVKIHWWGDLTPSEPSVTFMMFPHKKRPDYCAAIVEVKKPISVDKLLETYYPEDREKPAGVVVITKNSHLLSQLKDLYVEKVVNPDSDPTLFIDSLFDEWGMLGFERDLPAYGVMYNEEAIFVSKSANFSADIVNWGELIKWYE